MRNTQPAPSSQPRSTTLRLIPRIRLRAVDSTGNDQSMDETVAGDLQARILSFWWTIELFSPQQIPAVPPPLAQPADHRVTEWRLDDVLPWKSLPPPPPLHDTPRRWRHTVFLGVYELEESYQFLHRVFRDDADAYDERPRGLSACAGLLVDERGLLVPQSCVLSSALWGIGRIRRTAADGRLSLSGFSEAQGAFAEGVDASESRRRDAARVDDALPLDSDALTGLLRIAHMHAGVVGIAGLGTGRVIIESVAISERRADDPPDIDFLNSFYLSDLAEVASQVAKGNYGTALATYLAADNDREEVGRVDVVREPWVVDAGTVVERLPKGRWPSRPDQALALSQQFAVNQSLHTLGPSAGLTGVNGPPGTGKTTMLRDILAANVVERARRLARLKAPGDAFTPDPPHRWNTADGRPRIVRQLRPELTGFGMVVASANNGAVENVTTEIPVVTALAPQWRESADYFRSLATKILNEAAADGPQDTAQPLVAWGLVAARLGRKRNRTAFHSSFWFGDPDPIVSDPVTDSVPGMQKLLTQWRDGKVPVKPWAQARIDFTKVEHRVDALLEQRRTAQQRLRDLPTLGRQEDADTAHIESIKEDIEHLASVLKLQAALAESTAADLKRTLSDHDRHAAVKPGALESIFSLGRATREWRAALTPLADAVRDSSRTHQEAVEASRATQATLNDANASLAAAEYHLAEVRRSKEELLAQVAEDRRKYSLAHPAEARASDQRELHAPWLDEALDTARSELFLAALQLHQDFLAAAARDMLNGLRAAGDVLVGRYPFALESEKVRAAWQLFFLAVPLISTTFASAGRMFGSTGPEAIGWLLIDEAGQAAPQYAAASMWRARRVVAVGDPLQLQPVVTIPRKAQSDIAASYGVPAIWIPPRASVQTLADRATSWGTWLEQGEERVWVSSPLRVHRRCDDPMFTLCNAIAYNNLMINGVHRDPLPPEDPLSQDAIMPAPPSQWMDEPAKTPGTHLQPNQIQRLESELARLKRCGIECSQVVVISPFRVVADALRKLSSRHPGLRAGTIHTVQGKEAPIVFLVLGGDPDSEGARVWASSSVNLVNVAASRAQRRLYVIGDRATWRKHPYFRQLSAVLP